MGKTIIWDPAQARRAGLVVEESEVRSERNGKWKAKQQKVVMAQVE